MASTDSKIDWIPVVSQLRSILEFVGQDSTGAVSTHHQFLRRCPIVSQAA
ncbi:hypothetical protein FO519_010706, partial [Halicephalobus sp. NKZ332]